MDGRGAEWGLWISGDWTAEWGVRGDAWTPAAPEFVSVVRGRRVSSRGMDCGPPSLCVWALVSFWGFGGFHQEVGRHP